MSRHYPYTATRVKVMHSLLLGKDDYMRLRKMGLHEIIRSLQDGLYKKEIGMLSKDYDGIELINIALNENLANCVNKLVLISVHEELKNIIKLYSLKWVIKNLKIALRARMNQFDANDMKYSIIPIIPASRDFCYSLLKKENNAIIEDMRKILPLSDEFKAYLMNSNLVAMENELDKAYYISLYKAANNAKPHLRRFFMSLIELTNIKTVLKTKATGMDNAAIKKYIVGRETSIIKKLMAADKERAAEILEKSGYPLEFGDMSGLESSMERFLLSFSFRLLHISPLTEAPIFGYLLAKEIELRNLRLLVNAKAMNMDEGFIDKNIIMAI